MGQVLFWLGAAVAWALFVALGVAVVARIAGRWRCAVIVLWAVLSALPWALAVAAFGLLELWLGGARVPLVCSALAGAALIVAALVIRARARKTSPAAWPLGRVALAWVVALALTVMTFWNLDLAVRQKMAVMHVKTCAVALSIAPPPMPDAQNAAVLYRQAREILDALTPEGQSWSVALSDWLDPYESEFDPDDEQMLAFLQRTQPALDTLRDAASRPGCNFGADYAPPSVDMKMPWLGEALDLGVLLCLSARVAAAEGRTADAMADVHAVWALARHWSAEPPLLSVLVAFRMERYAFETFQCVLDAGPLTRDSLDAAGGKEVVSYRDILHRSIRMEMAFGMSVFSTNNPCDAFTIYVTDWTDFPPTRTTFRPIPTAAVAPYRVFLWDQDAATYLRWMRGYEDLSSRPYHETIREWQALKVEVREGFRGLLARILHMGWNKTGSFAAVADARHRLATLALALWDYRLAEGAFPDELDRLVPRYLPAVPIDPFTGEALTMARTTDGLVLYSVGPDLTDDGGEPSPSDWVTEPGDISLRLDR